MNLRKFHVGKEDFLLSSGTKIKSIALVVAEKNASKVGKI